MIENLNLDHDPHSAKRARTFVTGHLAGHARELVDRAALMVSELVTNSIRHTTGPCAVTLELTPRLLHVGVHDLGPATPTIRSPSPDDPSGRGLRIVAELSDEWGIVSTPEGDNTVWFSVSLDPAEHRVEASAQSSAAIRSDTGGRASGVNGSER